MRKLNHPHIVKLYEVINDPVSPSIYFVMDYLPGKTIENIIEEVTDAETHVPMDKVWKWSRQIISALTYCHEETSVVHRDIKPENVMLNENDDAVVVDFGVSALFEGEDD